jgi:hypothetical protein
VIAALRALELLYQNAAPDWFALLSAADYPTMPAEKVLEELASGGMDALLDYREVPNINSNLPYHTPENPALKHFESSANFALAWHRYIGFNFWFPIVRSGPRIGRYTVHLPFEDWRSPFELQFKCFYGDHWFTGNRKVAEILLNPTDKHMQLRRHLRLRACSDECNYQTVLANTSGLKISKATRRFAEWSSGGAHPRVLGLNDLPSIISSKAHFARKFAPESPVLDEIDKLLL